MGTCHSRGAGNDGGSFTLQLQPLLVLLGLVSSGSVLPGRAAGATMSNLLTAFRAVFAKPRDPDSAPAPSLQASLLCLWPADPVLQQDVVRVLAPASSAVTTFSATNHQRARAYSVLNALAPHEEACTGRSCGLCFGLFVLWAWLLSVAPSGTLSTVYYRLRLDPYPRTRAHSSALLQLKAEVLSRGGTSISGAVHAAQCRKLSRLLSRPAMGGLPSVMSRGELLPDTEFAAFIEEFTLQCLVDMQRKVQGWFSEGVWVGAPQEDARTRASSPSFRATMLHVLADLVREPVPKPARRQSITARLAAMLTGGTQSLEPATAASGSALSQQAAPALVAVVLATSSPVHAKRRGSKQPSTALVTPASSSNSSVDSPAQTSQAEHTGWNVQHNKRPSVVPFGPSTCFPAQSRLTKAECAVGAHAAVSTVDTPSLSDVLQADSYWGSASDMDTDESKSETGSLG